MWLTVCCEILEVGSRAGNSGGASKFQSSLSLYPVFHLCGPTKTVNLPIFSSSSHASWRRPFFSLAPPNDKVLLRSLRPPVRLICIIYRIKGGLKTSFLFSRLHTRPFLRTIVLLLSTLRLFFFPPPPLLPGKERSAKFFGPSFLVDGSMSIWAAPPMQLRTHFFFFCAPVGSFQYLFLNPLPLFTGSSILDWFFFGAVTTSCWARHCLKPRFRRR